MIPNSEDERVVAKSALIVLGTLLMIVAFLVGLMIWLLFIDPPAHAVNLRGIWRGVCERLISNDPHPFAEDSTVSLIELYRFNPNKEVRRELKYRLDSGKLEQREAVSIIHLLEGEENE